MKSAWVQKEIDFARGVRQQRQDGYAIISLLCGVTPVEAKPLFGEELVSINVRDGPGSLDQALPTITAALGLGLPPDPRPPNPKLERPVAELIVALTDPAVYQAEGKRRAQATATVTYVPSADASRKVESRRYRFI